MLAFSILLSLFVDFQFTNQMVENLPYLELKDLQTVEMMNILQQQGNSNSYQYLSLIYWIGVLISASLLWRRIYVLFKQKGLNNGLESYSFFGYVFIAEEAKGNEMIRMHEEIHVKKRHSYDLLFIEIIQLFNWFNPLFYFLKRSLKFVHECQVDACFSINKVAYAELLIAQAFQVDAAVLRHDFSNQSILKRRIQMLFRKPSTALNRLHYLLVFPISFLGFLLIKNTQAHTLPDILPDQIFVENKPGRELINQGQILNYNAVDQPPTYPGGIRAFQKLVYESMVCSQAAISSGVKGIVEVSFTISSTGEVQDFEIIRDLGYELGESVISAIKRSKIWQPAIKEKRPVAIRYLLPVRVDFSQEL